MNGKKYIPARSHSYILPSSEGEFDLVKAIEEIKTPTFDAPIIDFDSPPATPHDGWSKLANEILSHIGDEYYQKIMQKQRNLENDVFMKSVRKINAPAKFYHHKKRRRHLRKDRFPSTSTHEFSPSCSPISPLTHATTKKADEIALPSLAKDTQDYSFSSQFQKFKTIKMNPMNTEVSKNYDRRRIPENDRRTRNKSMNVLPNLEKKSQDHSETIEKETNISVNHVPSIFDTALDHFQRSKSVLNISEIRKIKANNNNKNEVNNHQLQREEGRYIDLKQIKEKKPEVNQYSENIFQTRKKWIQQNKSQNEVKGEESKAKEISLPKLNSTKIPSLKLDQVTPKFQRKNLRQNSTIRYDQYLKEDFFSISQSKNQTKEKIKKIYRTNNNKQFSLKR